jgi:hypothetical protein
MESLNYLNSQQDKSQFSIEDLPESTLLKVFSYLSFSHVAQVRLVSVKFSNIGTKCLNKGFDHLCSTILKRVKQIEAQLPAIESHRAAHPFNKHYQVVVELHLIVAALGPHVEYVYSKTKKHCYFPGKMLDQMWKIIQNINLKTECQINLKGLFQ